MTKLITIIFIGLFVAILIGADKGALPGFVRSLYAFPGGDKIGHFLLMGALSWLINLSLRARLAPVLSRNILLGSAIVFVFVTLEEISQLWLKSRSFSLLDLGFSYAGIFCGGRLALLALRRKRTTIVSDHL
jgi:polysaccharide biosynthesis protein VpsQ